LVEVIAEAGSNHNGRLDHALQLVDVAAESGATSVKFQFIFPEGLYVPKYFNDGEYIQNEVYEQRHKEQLSYEEWLIVWRRCVEYELEVFASVFCSQGIELLKTLGAKTVKIASTDLNNYELIIECLLCFDRCIISTGMATVSDIDATLRKVLRYAKNCDVELMHCVSAYPCKASDANLERISVLAKAFGLKVGYSDHTLGSSSACAAMALGCKTYEKHFTFDRSLPGFDHAHAMDKNTLADYVSTLNELEEALKYKPQMSEKEAVTKNRARRGIYASKNLKQGSILRREDLLVVRPSTSLEPTDLDLLVGTALSHDIGQFQALTLDHKASASRNFNKSAVEYWAKEMHDKGMRKK
jgi:N,N'-diacetyllegionaminate synthase